VRFRAVVQEQDHASDRQQDRGGDDQRPIHGGGSLSSGGEELDEPRLTNWASGGRPGGSCGR
jgi:hypothetical protein